MSRTVKPFAAKKSEAPRYVTFAGVEAPKLNDIIRHARTLAERKLPMHAKPQAVRAIDFAALLKLRMSRARRQHLTELIRWCTDVEKYEEILTRTRDRSDFRTKGRSAMLTADEEILVAIGKWQRSEDDEIRFGSNAFFVVEALKARRRAILEPLLNDLLTKADMSKFSLPQRSEIRQLLASHSFYTSYDASAYYDQFPLSAAVSSFFAVVRGSHSFRQMTLPMGFKPACEIAQCTSMALLDFPHPQGSTSRAYIDNFLFFATTLEGLQETVALFVARCASVGVVLNASEQVFSTHECIGACTASFDCLGERYSLIRQTRELTDATLAKLKAASSLLREQTTEVVSARRMAALFGILFYAAPILRTKLCRFPDALNYYRALSAMATDVGWNTAAPRMSPLASAQVSAWLLESLENKPVPLTEAHRPPALVITVDASLAGWGCIVEPVDAPCSFAAFEWSPSDHQQNALWSSVVAEPLAVVRAVVHCLPAGVHEVLIRSDHQPLVSSAARGYARCGPYNSMLARLAEIFPAVSFKFEHVPGVLNRADPYSRGQHGWTKAVSPLGPLQQTDLSLRVGTVFPLVRVG